MAKHKTKFLVTTILLIGVCVIITCILMYIKYKDIKYFIFNDTNETIKIDIRNTQSIQDLLDNQKISIKEDDETNTYTFKELELTNKITKEQQEYIDNNKEIYYNDLNIKYNNKNLKKFIKGLNKRREDNKYATLEKQDNKFVVTEESHGNKLNTNKLLKYIKSNFGESNIEVDLKSFYIEFDDTKPSYEELKQVLKGFNDIFVSYTNGYTLKMSDLTDYLIVENNQIKFDNDKLDEYTYFIDKTIEKELKSYDTVGKQREFKTSKGNTIAVSGGTYGNIFSSDDETQYIIELFNNNKNEKDRTPIYSKELPDEIGNTYIEISISDQHLWYYVDGVLDSETDIVTGRAGKHDTPKGVYYISERINGKYLTGDTYKTWVNKWMRLTNRGIGLHDASWRGRFGGSIYKSNGSHGCINLPSAFAYSLFDKVRVNDCVIVY